MRTVVSNKTDLAEATPSPARRVDGEPLWLLFEPDPVYAVLHMPEMGGSATPVAVLMLPTFGWDNDYSYRSRRNWASALARAGYPTLRIDLPGSDDSVGSPLTPGRFRTWQEAVAGSAQWLRESCGAKRVVAVGIGLGGLLAYQAAAASAPIDDLILWGVSARGHSYLRGLRTFAEVVAGSLGESRDKERTDGALGIGGYLMSAETAVALSELALDELVLPNASERRVLLLGRDAHGVDPKLQAHLIDQGVKLAPQEAADYKSLMAVAEFDLSPAETIARSIEWLAGEPSTEISRDARAPAPPTATSVTFEESGTTITERLTSVDTPRGRMVGIIAEPLARGRSETCLITVNAGALRRTGPNRLSTAVARHAAAVVGMPSARFDLPGLGDSDGRYVQRTEHTDTDEEEGVRLISTIMNHLESGPDAIGQRFVSSGLCSAAYWPMRAALEDKRLVGCVLINLGTFRWTPKDAERARQPYPDLEATEGPLLQRAKARVRAVVVAVALKTTGSLPWKVKYRTDLADARRVFEGLHSSGAHALLLFSEAEPMWEALHRSGMAKRISKWPEVRVQSLPTVDHDLRPLWIQKMLVDLVEAELRDLSPEAADRDRFPAPN